MAQMTVSHLRELMAAEPDFTKRNWEPTLYFLPLTEEYVIAVAQDGPEDGDPIATRSEVERMIGGDLAFLDGLEHTERVIELTLGQINVSIEDM